MSYKSRLAWLISFFVLLVFGCSGNGNPGAPPVTEQTTNLEGAYIPPEADSDNRFLWGYHQIYIDSDADEYKIVPVRQATDHWNVLAWLEGGPCANCFKVTDIIPTPLGTLQVFIEIKHPFAIASLTGFDVRGIAMSHGTHSFPISGLITTNRFAGQAELVNADGYTNLYNPFNWETGPGGLQGYIQGKYATIPYPDTTLNGYIKHISVDPSNTRNAFYAGDSVTRIYEIYKPDGAFILGYAVDACWVPPTTTPVTDPMNDFPPEANCPEPWMIDVTETPVGAGLTYQGGEVILTIDVYDYQGKFSHYVPRLECSELFDGTLYATYESSETGFATFEVTVENEKLAPDGLYKCLITVEDLDNAGAPDWLDLTAYYIHELGVGAQAPPIVENFNASDAEPSLPNRKVELTWNALDDSVDWYDIQRLDYDWDTGWFWKQVKSSPHPETSWIDGNPRYCGPVDSLQYRISARNDAGSSPGYATDTGYPRERGFNMSLWCVADDTGGTNAATTWDRAMADFNDCNSFWNPYGMNFVLQNDGGFFWVGDPSYKNITEGEAPAMHDDYGKVNHPESINVYYVCTSDGDAKRAYCYALCPALFHNTENVFIIISKDTRGVPPNDLPIVLAHECGHAIGHFWDVYLLDTNHNLILDDGTSCESTNTWCTDWPNIDPLFCDKNAGYQQNPDAEDKNPWNLMWFSCPGKQIINYDIIDTQCVYLHEWVHANKANYPWPD